MFNDFIVIWILMKLKILGKIDFVGFELWKCIMLLIINYYDVEMFSEIIGLFVFRIVWFK